MNSPPPNPPPGDGSGKKVRKPYTITKSRESWTEEEHEKFLEALQLFDRDWKKIEDFVGSKSVIQIRSHAQKYFLKVQKNGTVAHVPPPRPKRKAAHPYPQKAPKNDLVPLQASVPYTSASVNSLTLGYPTWNDASVLVNHPSSGTIQSEKVCNLPGAEGMHKISFCVLFSLHKPWLQCSIQHTFIYNITWKFTYQKELFHLVTRDISELVYIEPKGTTSDYDCSLRGPTISKSTKQGKQGSILHGIPDFAAVYGFIGSVFDPDTKDHVQKLKEMDPINFETVLLLMRNLTINLSNPDSESITKVLSSYDVAANNFAASPGRIISAEY